MNIVIRQSLNVIDEINCPDNLTNTIKDVQICAKTKQLIIKKKYPLFELFVDKYVTIKSFTKSTIGLTDTYRQLTDLPITISDKERMVLFHKTIQELYLNNPELLEYPHQANYHPFKNDIENKTWFTIYLAIRRIQIEKQIAILQVDAVIATKGLQASPEDSSALAAWVDEVLAKNPDNVAQFKAGKEKALNALVGQVMKASQGKANPQEINKLLKAKLLTN